MTTAPLRIVVATDERYVAPTAASVRSVIDTLAAGDTLEIAVLACDLSENSREQLVLSWNDPRCGVVIADVDVSRFARLPITSAASNRLTRAAYARLMLGQLLPDHWHRVIYLDTYTITRRPLHPLWNTDLAGNLIGAVRDDYIPTVASPHGIPTWHKLGLPADLPYFNSGVMLIDVDAWRNEDLGERALAYLAEHPDDISLFDQDALNAVIAGRWLELDTIWNVTGYWRKAARRTGRHQHILTTAAIRHFTGNGKPWDAQPLNVPDGALFFASLARTQWPHWRAPDHQPAVPQTAGEH